MPKIKETSVPILNYLLDYFLVFSSHLNQLKYLCGVAVLPSANYGQKDRLR